MTRYYGTATGWLNLATGELVDAGAPIDPPPPPPPADPVNTTAPVIVGTPTAGVEADYAPGVWENVNTVTYTWRMDDLAVGKPFTPTAADAGKSLVLREFGNGNITVPVDSAPKTIAAAPVVAPSAAIFAGHRPDEVMVGMATPENQSFPPTYDDTLTKGGVTYPSAFDIVTKPRPSMDSLGDVSSGMRVRRTFTNSNINLAGLREMISRCEPHGLFGLLSFKHSNFADFYQGRMDGALAIIRDEMVRRRTAGPGGTPLPPHAVGIYHEPSGDEGIVLSEWAKMQIYCSNKLAGYGTNTTTWGRAGTYDPTWDVRDQMTWMSIMNGNNWGPNQVATQAINDAHPQTLIDTYRRNGSLLGADFYDGVPRSNDLRDYNAKSDRTSKKIAEYIQWHRDRNSGLLFAGEYSATTAAEVYEVWKVVSANRDIFPIMNYFASGQNSKWEWRPLPADYPPTNGWSLSQYSPGNGNEIGGHDGGFATAPGHSTVGNLKMLRQTIYESTQPAYTGPLGA